jgi:PleD family two-component response regulator
MASPPRAKRSITRFTDRRSGHEVEYAIEGTLERKSEEGGCIAMKGKKILLVQDDAGVAYAMAVRLKAKEFTLVMAADAIGPIAIARKEKPDLIILDLGLPGV